MVKLFKKNCMTGIKIFKNLLALPKKYVYFGCQWGKMVKFPIKGGERCLLVVLNTVLIAKVE